MSRPSQEQIDDYVWRSRNNTYAPTRSMADEVITCLADDLKAAREELDRLRLADFDGLNKQRAELIEELSRAKAENDAMAALLEDGPHHDDDECDADYGATECRWQGIGEPRPHEPCWRHRRLAILEDRVKRMGEKAAGR